MIRCLLQMAFSETDGERPRVHYWEFAHWITLTLYDKKQEEGRSLLVLMFRKVFLVHLLEAEGLSTWSDCRLPHMSSASMKMHYSLHRPSLPLLTERSFPYISMENSMLALHKPHKLIPFNEVNLCGPSKRLCAGEARCKMDLGWK